MRFSDRVDGRMMVDEVTEGTRLIVVLRLKIQLKGGNAKGQRHLAQSGETNPSFTCYVGLENTDFVENTEQTAALNERV